MNIDDARKNFLEINAILNRLNVRFFLSEGTLLGAVRDGDFIAWDHDLDLRIMPTDWKSEMRKDFENAGFHYKEALCKRLYKDKSSGCVVAKRRIRTDLALNYYYPPDDLYLTLAHRPNNLNTLRTASFYRGENFINFIGVKVRVPYPPEDYLKIPYGKDWRIPRQDPYYLEGRHAISMEKYINYFMKYPTVNQ